MSMLYGSGSDDAPYRELKFERAVEGEVNFLVDRKSGFNHSSTFETLNRYFTDEFLTKYAFDVSYKGGRGSTMLFALPYENAVLMYGPKKDPTLVNQHSVVHSNPNEIPSSLKVSHVSRSGASLKSASFPPASSANQPEKVVSKAAGHPQRVSTLGVDNNDLESTPSYYILCLRPYMRGGLIGKVMKDKYLRFSETALRARNEFCLLQRLYKMGLPVPRPLIAREQIGFMFVKNAILIEQIPNTSNLAELMIKDEISIDHLLAVGTTLKRFFTREVMHTDLNIRNILIDDNNKCFIIDFDKCYIKDDFSTDDCERMLARLERSFKKELTSLLSDEKDAQKIAKLAQSLIEPIRNAALGIEVEDPSELLLPTLSKKDETSGEGDTGVDFSNKESHHKSQNEKALDADKVKECSADSDTAVSNNADYKKEAAYVATDSLKAVDSSYEEKDTNSCSNKDSASAKTDESSVKDNHQSDDYILDHDKLSLDNANLSDESSKNSSDDFNAQEKTTASLKKAVLPKSTESSAFNESNKDDSQKESSKNDEFDSLDKKEPNEDKDGDTDSISLSQNATSQENDEMLADNDFDNKKANRKSSKIPRGLRKNKKS